MWTGRFGQLDVSSLWEDRVGFKDGTQPEQIVAGPKLDFGPMRISFGPTLTLRMENDAVGIADTYAGEGQCFPGGRDRLLDQFVEIKRTGQRF